MRPIPLIRARYLQAFVGALEEVGHPAEPLLERLGIHPTALTDPEAVHPSHQVWAFAAEAARETGRVDLGWRAARVVCGQAGEMASRVTTASTLREALAAFCEEARQEHSRAAFRVSEGQRTAWFRRERLSGTPDERLQIELLVLGVMVRRVRLAAGKDWWPREIQLQSPSRPDLAGLAPLSHAEVRFERPATAVAFPRSLLAAVLAPGRGPRRAPTEGTSTRPPLATDFVGSLRQLLESCLSDGPPRIEFAARAARCSVRTLQRRLHGVGLSYSRLVEEVRLSTAAQRLQNATPRLVEIALDAGYSDQANFTRAFRRWSGVPPSQFRRLSIEQGRRLELSTIPS